MNEDELRKKAKLIKLVIFDVDGVLTDGSLFFGDDGQEYKAFNSLDGHGMKMLQNSGVQIGIITGRTSDVVLHRMKNLGVDLVYQGQRDKLPAYRQLLSDLQLEPEQVAYVGDDVVDLPVMLRAGLALTVANAHPLAKQHAAWVSAKHGGHGAAREICEMIMQAQGTLQPQLQQYLQLDD